MTNTHTFPNRAHLSSLVVETDGSLLYTCRSYHLHHCEQSVGNASTMTHLLDVVHAYQLDRERTTPHLHAVWIELRRRADAFQEGMVRVE